MLQMVVKVVCPFCGEEHIIKNISNRICNCGGKFYIFDGFWLNRNTGNKVHMTPAEQIVRQKWLRERFGILSGN